ncbi:Calcium influx-promoting protein ehs1 [Lachnellula suecica]|uniref:Calcium influx-promoting protein ehs1 n=1 Tax=Lachnellula suecica TaxID=602035 RepID=A0A8T9BZA3_9HELO|nr:Calcium influx-promoting protein ehs1 [Lachnellula suecica]
MPLPKLSPLQSRLAASLIASLMLLLLYFTFASPHFAYAADVDSIRAEDHNHERLLARPFLDIDVDGLELREMAYEVEFMGIDRGIIGRAPTGNEPTGVINNRKEQINIALGQTVSYMFTNASLWGAKSTTKAYLSPLRLQGRDYEDEDDLEDEDGEEEELKLKPRQSSSSDFRTLYISVTACTQPKALDNTTSVPAPQLQLYISQSPNNTTPGPGNAPQSMVELDGGYAMYALNATGDVYFGVFGNNNTKTAFNDLPWNVEIAASIDAPYHYYYNSSDNLAFTDSDASAALLVAGNPMKLDGSGNNWSKWENASTPFRVFMTKSDDQSIVGLQNSYCAWKQIDQGQISVNSTVAKRSIANHLPEERFYVAGLAAGTKYHVSLAMDGNSTDAGLGVVGGGGIVFRQTNFSTSIDNNCAVITGLSFCEDVSYRVPSNLNNFANATLLANFYDNYALQQFQYFENVLSTVPCETTSSAQYSLARTCENCTAAYKQWLCAVAIPRCTDFSFPASEDYLRPRAMGFPFPNGTLLPADPNRPAYLNNSRNPVIDANVTSGPYQEILPCEDLCYHVVQSCPASMGFECPMPDSLTFTQSYGSITITSSSASGNATPVSCNYPGETLFSGGSLALPSQVLMVVIWVGMGLMCI